MKPRAPVAQGGFGDVWGEAGPGIFTRPALRIRSKCFESHAAWCSGALDNLRGMINHCGVERPSTPRSLFERRKLPAQDILNCLGPHLASLLPPPPSPPPGSSSFDETWESSLYGGLVFARPFCCITEVVFLGVPPPFFPGILLSRKPPKARGYGGFSKTRYNLLSHFSQPCSKVRWWRSTASPRWWWRGSTSPT